MLFTYFVEFEQPSYMYYLTSKTNSGWDSLCRDADNLYEGGGVLTVNFHDTHVIYRVVKHKYRLMLLVPCVPMMQHVSALVIFDCG